MNTVNPKQHGYTDKELHESELRFRALSYLVSNFDKWPTTIKRDEISNRKFKTFRFVRSDDNNIYFTNW